jgi:hypothetical protein
MSQESRWKLPDPFRSLLIWTLRVALVGALIGAGWLVYRELPATSASDSRSLTATNLQVVMHPPDNGGAALDVLVSLYPIDVVAVRHEFFAEPRAGKRYEDFLKERMKGRSPISMKLDKQGYGTVVLSPGNWWLHAILDGDEKLEWHLPVTVRGAKQTVELTPQNAYTRSRTF